jgi:hypothetical protein
MVRFLQARLKRTKDEFETTDQFLARSADTAANIAPLQLDALYAFPLEGDLKYDADREAYVGSSTNYPPCREPESATAEYGHWLACPSLTQYDVDTTYIGTNAFGVTVRVHKYRGLDAYVAFSTDEPQSPFLTRFTVPLDLPRGRGDDRVQLGSVPVPLELARRNRGKTVRLLVAGTLAKATIVRVTGRAHEPTRDIPEDSLFDAGAIPITAKAVILYVHETGEVLFRQDF